MTFLQASLDLFTGARVGHMIGDHYVAHAAKRNGKSMSGPALWAEAERAREAAANSNLVSAEQKLLQQVVRDIAHLIPAGTHVVELGPGTLSAFTKKTLPVIRALGTTDVTLVDGSAFFLKDILTSNVAPDLHLQGIEDDFFTGAQPYRDSETPDLVCSFGSTISNVIAPQSDESPTNALLGSLTQFSQAIGPGWLLIGFDSSQNGNAHKAYYEAASAFFLSVFYRMAAELPISGAFDPAGFTYQADWNPSSGQIAHIAVVNHDMQFTLAGRKIFLYEGQKFHMKNSYKYRPEFFEACCARVGLDIAAAWSDASPARIYLLQKRPHLIAERPHALVANDRKQITPIR
jgi:uncharacterized SAM-dependent methyltransferase